MRYVHLPAAAVDTQLLEDATRRGTFLFSLLWVGLRRGGVEWEGGKGGLGYCGWELTKYRGGCGSTGG